MTRTGLRMGLRFAAVAALALWMLALLLPVQSHFINRQYPAASVPGYTLLEWGWLGPLSFSFAWYANVTFAICVNSMLRGRRPNFALCFGSFALAASALIPSLMLYGHEFVWTTYSGPGIWSWFAAFALVTVASYVAGRLGVIFPR